VRFRDDDRSRTGSIARVGDIDSSGLFGRPDACAERLRQHSRRGSDADGIAGERRRDAIAWTYVIDARSHL
jgi:hypothetical protein